MCTAWRRTGSSQQCSTTRHCWWRWPNALFPRISLFVGFGHRPSPEIDFCICWARPFKRHYPSSWWVNGPMSSSQVFFPYRAIGLFCDAVPFAIEKLGNNHTIVSSVYKSFQVYSVRATSSQAPSLAETDCHHTLLACCWSYRDQSSVFSA